MSTLIPAIVFLALPALNDSSIVETERRALADSNGLGRVTVRCVGFDDSKPDETWPLAVRVIAKVGDRSLDGSGRGLYSDGRFFAERSFELESPAGTLALEVRSGPDYVSANGTVVVEAGKHVEVTAKLRRWFSPKSRSWYSGDNHVHAQHDRKAAVRTDLAYTALQGRANGLDFVTEAGSHVDYDELEKLSSPRFLFRNADEIRLGCFVGHVNAPGIREPIPYSLLAKLGKSPLPIGHLLPEIHRRGGAAIHTHPMVPPQQIHWMGATELYSDAVLSNCADALDIDSRATEALWFAAINAGNRMAASGSTDAALGRERTRAPGDRRVYVRSKSFDMPSLVRGIRSSHTYATNAGPIHAFLRVEGSGPGETATVTGKSLDVQVEVRHLRPLRSIELYLRGRRVHAFRAASTRPESSVFSISLPLPQDMTGQPWIVLRAEDVRGSWATTSPVYLKTPVESEPSPSSTWASVLQISNATRFIELRKTFFAHVICTVRDDAIAGVALYRDDELVQRITPAEGDSISGGKTPVTELRGDYGPGRIWHPKTKPAHVQWDIPVSERGWYWTRILTASGRKLDSDRMFFDPKHTRSHQVSSAVLYARDTELRQWGYGEEMPLAEIQSPFEGDHWWYPQRSTWRMEGRFGSETRVYFGGDKRGLRLVRRPPTESALAPRKPIRLFDRGLDRFYSWTKDHGYRDPERVFRFDGDTLRISGEEDGYLGTRESYRDYELRLEFRWGEGNAKRRAGKARDSGLFLHSRGPDGNSHDGDGAFRAAIECQIMEGASGDLMLIRGKDRKGQLLPLSLKTHIAKKLDSDGWPFYAEGGKERKIETWGRLNWNAKDSTWRDEFGFRGTRDVEAQPGTWNRLVVRAEGGEIEVRLNDQIVNRAFDVEPREGAILLQSEGSEVYFRNLELHPLSTR